MVVIFVLRGLPGSGKSTLSNEIQAIGRHLNVVVISRDLCRKEISKTKEIAHWDYSPFMEGLASELFHQQGAQAMRDPLVDWVIIDNTTLSKARIWEIDDLIRIGRDEMQRVVHTVFLQLGFWMSSIEPRFNVVPEAVETRMRREFGDSHEALWKYCSKTPNVWFFKSNSYADSLKISSRPPFVNEWSTMIVGGWTKITTEELLRFFDPSLLKQRSRRTPLIFLPFSTVFNKYFIE